MATNYDNDGHSNDGCLAYVHISRHCRGRYCLPCDRHWCGLWPSLLWPMKSESRVWWSGYFTRLWS